MVDGINPALPRIRNIPYFPQFRVVVPGSMWGLGFGQGSLVG